MFRKFLAWLKDWFEVPERVAPEPPAAHPDNAITRFFLHTAEGSPTQAAMMGSLAGRVSPRDFASLCRGFAEGVEYVHQRFGTVPQDIIISDEDRASPRYNIDSRCIYIPRRWIADMISMRNVRQSKTDPLILPFDRMAVMYGIEEAFHHYQVARHDRDYNFSNLGQPDGTPGYDRDNPLERDTKVVVRDGLHDFGLLTYPAANANVEPEDAAWLAAARGCTQPNTPCPENLIRPLLLATPLLERVGLAVPHQNADDLNKLLHDSGAMYASGTWRTERGEELTINGTHDPVTRWRVQRVLGEAYQALSNETLKGQLGDFMRAATLSVPAAAATPTIRPVAHPATSLAFAR